MLNPDFGFFFGFEIYNSSGIRLGLRILENCNFSFEDFQKQIKLFSQVTLY